MLQKSNIMILSASSVVPCHGGACSWTTVAACLPVSLLRHGTASHLAVGSQARACACCPPPLASVALLKREARTRPRWNHRHGLSGWSVLYPCCDCDRSSPPVSRLLGEGRPKLPSPLDVMRNYSIESSIMAHHGDGVPL
jgi:hypothetical protein